VETVKELWGQAFGPAAGLRPGVRLRLGMTTQQCRRYLWKRVWPSASAWTTSWAISGWRRSAGRGGPGPGIGPETASQAEGDAGPKPSGSPKGLTPREAPRISGILGSIAHPSGNTPFCTTGKHGTMKTRYHRVVVGPVVCYPSPIRLSS